LVPALPHGGRVHGPHRRLHAHARRDPGGSRRTLRGRPSHGHPQRRRLPSLPRPRASAQLKKSTGTATLTALRAGPYVLTVNSLRRASRAHRSTPEIRRFVVLTLLACLATFGLVACGGGGGVPSLSVPPVSASL